MKKKTAATSGTAELRRNPRPLLRAALIVAIYLIAFLLLDFITKQFEGLPGVVVWYPPAGLTYALLLVCGVSFAPAVTIAFLISSLFIYHIPQPPYLLFLWALLISLIYSVAAAFLRKRIRFDWQLRKLRDVTWFVFTTVLVSALLAILSVSCSALSNALPRSEILRAIFDWWIGETVGVLTVTPFLLIYVMPGLKRFVEGQLVRLPARRSFPPPTLSAIGQSASIALALYLAFGAPALAEFHPLYLITLPLIWIALTRGFKGISVAILALNTGVVLALWLFRFDPARLGELELLMIVNCMVSFLMGAVVSERKQAEQEIVSLAKYPSENPNPVLRLSRDGLVMDANPASGALLGLWGCAVGGSAPQFWRDLAAQALASRKNKIVDIECDGKVYSMFVTPVAELGYVNLYGRDITERKQAEETLWKSEQRLATLISNLPGFVYRCANDRNWTTIFFSEGCRDITGYAPEDFLQNKKLAYNDIIRQDYRERLWLKWQTCLENKIAFEEEYPITTAQGETRWLWERGRGIFSEDGRLLFLEGFITDITERKRMEAERQVLLEILQGVAATESLDELLELIRRSIAKVIYAENFFVVFKNKSSGLFEEVFAVDKYDPPMSPSKLEKSLTSYVFRTGQPLLLTQAKFEELVARREAELVGTKPATWLGAPLKLPNETIGVIVVQNYEDPDCYSERDKEFLTSVSAQVATVIERKRSEEEIKKQLDELQRWQAATLGRENRILDLKREVNELLGKTGQPPRYASAQDLKGLEDL